MRAEFCSDWCTYGIISREKQQCSLHGEHGGLSSSRQRFRVLSNWIMYRQHMKAADGHPAQRSYGHADGNCSKLLVGNSEAGVW